jgi:hypothetical protein
MRKHYKNEKIMKFLTILGAIVGLAWIISGLLALGGYGFIPPSWNFIPSLFPSQIIYVVIVYLVGLVIVILTFLVALKSNPPLPFNWIVLIILAILLVIFQAGIYACVLLIIAALIGIIEDL